MPLTPPRFSRTVTLLAVFVSLCGCATDRQPRDTGIVSTGGAVRALSPGDEHTANLGNDDPVEPLAGSPYHVYRLRLEEGDVLRTVARSSEYAPVLSLFSPDHELVATKWIFPTNDTETAGSSNGGGDEDQRSTLVGVAETSGSYLLAVSSGRLGQYGAYRLEAALTSERAAQIEIGGRFQSILRPASEEESTDTEDDGDRMQPALERSMTGTGLPVDTHAFTIDEPTVLEAAVTSPDFTAQIWILDAATDRPIDESDDASFERTELASYLPAGDYLMSVRSSDPDQLGRYTLETARVDVDAAEDFEFGESFDHFLGATMSSIPQSSRKGEPIEFEVHRQRLLEVAMRSESLDAYLILTASSGDVVSRNDDASGSRDASLAVPLEPGEYTLWATSSVADRRGPYTIDATLSDLPEPDEFAVGETYESFIGIRDEPIPGERCVGEPLPLQIEGERVVEVTMRSDVIEPFVVLTDPSGNQLTEEAHAADHDRIWRSRSIQTDEYRVRAPLQPGEYIAWAGNCYRNTTGPFTVEIDVGDIEE